MSLLFVCGRGGVCYVSLSARAGAEVGRSVRSCLKLLSSALPLNTAAAAPLLHAHPPTRRDRAFPGPAHSVTHGRGCRSPIRSIGAPAMIPRMLQPLSPSRDLFPEFLKAENEQTVTTRYRKSLSLSLSQGCEIEPAAQTTSRLLHKCPRMTSLCSHFCVSS